MAVLLAGLLFLLAIVAQATHPTNPFETEPTFRIERFNISRNGDTSEIAPGYLFLGPLEQKTAWGPQIYDMQGRLIYCGGHIRVQDFKACDFKGHKGDHLCWHRSRYHPPEDPTRPVNNPLKPSRPVGRKMVFDSSYRQVGRNYSTGLRSGEIFNYPNGHEYNMLPGGESFIQAVYKPKIEDLSEYTGSVRGWIQDGCFQEINVQNARALFTWCYSDHLPLWETQLFFVSDYQETNETSPKAGHGTKASPWDFMHLNAVDKTRDGDYLVSGRHLDQILKVAGNKNPYGYDPGSVIWRLGGKSNDFEMKDGFNFSRQHDVRIISANVNETTFSLYNNAWEGTNDPSAPQSSGMIISINEDTMEARLEREYLHPDGLLGRAMGSMQVLPNSNALLCWGASPQITEFSENGTVLWHAWYSLPHGPAEHEWTYRAYKFPWIGTPHWKPRLVAYRSSCHKDRTIPHVAYASWNGATNVKKWRFYIGASEEGPWYLASVEKSEGFETVSILSDFVNSAYLGMIRWVKAEAYGEDDDLLGDVVSETFIPRPAIRSQCGKYTCRRRDRDRDFDYPKRLSCITVCGRSRRLMGLVMFLIGLCVESFVFLWHWAVGATAVPVRGPEAGSWRRVQRVLPRGIRGGRGTGSTKEAGAFGMSLMNGHSQTSKSQGDTKQHERKNSKG